MTTAPDRCTHSFPDPFPQPIEQIGNCRDCGISYQEAKAAMSTADELRAAVAKLDVLLGELGDNRGPWYIDNQDKRPYPQSISNVGVPYCVATTTTDPHVPPYTALYICAMHPGTGKAIRAWLDSWTGIDFNERAAMPEDLRHALAVARQINAGSRP